MIYRLIVHNRDRDGPLFSIFPITDLRALELLNPVVICRRQPYSPYLLCMKIPLPATINYSSVLVDLAKESHDPETKKLVFMVNYPLPDSS